jgi:hypothetical protein
MEPRHTKVLSEKDPDLIAVLEQLKETHLPINYSRNNSGVGHSISLGKVSDRYHHRMNRHGRYDAKFPELRAAIWKLGKKIVPFPYTTVQVNYNYKTKPHIDRNNVGESLIVGLGDYVGGDLIVDKKRYDIRNHPLIFNGAELLHGTAPYKGDRYSLVFFKTADLGWKNPMH